MVFSVFVYYELLFFIIVLFILDNNDYKSLTLCFLNKIKDMYLCLNENKICKRKQKKKYLIQLPASLFPPSQGMIRMSPKETYITRLV